MSPDTTKESEAILGHHLESFVALNVDEVMKDFAEDSIVITHEDTFVGKARVREFFTNLLGGVTPEFLSKFKMAKQEVVGEIAYIAWSVEGMIALGTDTFVIRNSKIVAQTFAAV